MTASLSSKASLSFSFTILIFLTLHVIIASSKPLAIRTNPTQANHNETFQPKQGWTPSPDGRGTWDIVYGCGLTMSLCSWSILCLNVPGPKEKWLKVTLRKLGLTVIGFLGPEFIFLSALGQWYSARCSVTDFHASGYTQWTMSHAFFADMGGFVLRTGDDCSFPVDAKQVHYLVTKGHIKYPELDKRIIADKNKVDGLLRLITVCQTLWFVVSVSGRAYQHLTITCGELTTAAFIVCSMATTFCWYHKPADLKTSEVIKTDKTIAKIVEEAGVQGRQLHGRTPLDFVSRKEWASSLYWSNAKHFARRLHIKIGVTNTPVNRLENTTLFALPGSYMWIVTSLTAAYFAIFISGWNYEFPTPQEQTLWRAASLTMIAILGVYKSIEDSAFYIYPALRLRFVSTARRAPDTEIHRRSRHWPGQGRFSQKSHAIADYIRNNSEPHDPALYIPLKALLPQYFLAYIYLHARLYIFIEDVIELRSLPASAYQTINWTSFFPHF